jgi:CheY-like chemotaxis protein
MKRPLNCIVGMSSLLLEDSEETDMDPMHADSIRMIHTSGELLKAVVDDVLDYAKLESGAFLVDIKTTKLQDTLDSVVHSISQKMQEKDIRLRTHYSPILPEIIETDSRRLQQVLFNLLGNAGKFSHKSSVIDLTVKLARVSKQDRDGSEPGTFEVIRFSVKDYGKGIDSKDFEKIFKPFSQASKETQNVYGGTGLGLSITSKLVKRLGGTISVDSELDKFAEFTVDLPMNAEHHVNVSDVAKRLEKIEIVLVEPDQGYDYSFTSYPIQNESHPLSRDVSEVYGLNVVRCNSLDQTYKYLSGKGASAEDRHYALLIDEDLYSNDTDDKLIELVGKHRYTLMTHGPNYLVEHTRKRHFKILSGIFPVVLLNSIANHVAAHHAEREENTRVLGHLPSPETEHTISLGNSTREPTSQVVQSHAPTSIPTLPKEKAKKYDLKVLYAEDNVVNQKVLSRVLNRAGITDITIVDDGQKAVDVVATTRFDCIFMDMQMPVMDGMEATRIIMERDPSAKVIFVTAHALDDFKSRGDAVGAISFISKPFRVSDIEAVLEQIGIVSENELLSPAASVPNGNVLSENHDIAKPGVIHDTTLKKIANPGAENLNNGDELPVKTQSLGEGNRSQAIATKPLFQILLGGTGVPPNSTETPANVNPVSLREREHLRGSPPPPAVTPPTRNGSLKLAKEASPWKNLKVLYAEDNPINQKVLHRVLNRTGISDITIVDNGKKAVGITADTKFDCIFMDMQMPVMDGMEATKLIMERDPDAKVVFVTAHALEEYEKKATALGARSFLPKPVRVQDIEGVLRKLGL